MSTTRFEGLRLPIGFHYDDHPFIDHDESDYVITLDEGVANDPNHPGGWKVVREVGQRKFGNVGRRAMVDVLFCRSVDAAITFVQMITNTDPKLSFGYEVTKPRSAVFYGRA